MRELTPRTDKRCPACGVTKPLADFPANRSKASGVGTQCRDCGNRRELERSTRSCVRCGETLNSRGPIDGPDWMCHDCHKLLSGSGEKRCPDCGLTKPVSDFQRSNTYCRECRKQQQLARSARICAVCGTKLSTRRPADGPSALCKECKHTRAMEADRSGQRRPNPQQRQAVFERDNWICGICKRAISKTKKWPDPRSAVVDHIIPVSAGREAGGVNKMHNWQATHNECNLRKSDRLYQPALFG